MVCVRGGGVTTHLCQGLYVPLGRAFLAFHDEYRSPLTHYEPVAGFIEGPAGSRRAVIAPRKGPEGVEPCYGHRD